MCSCSALLNSLIVTEEAKSHLLRSTDRRIAPAVTMLYKRASQDVAQPMRLSLLCNSYPSLQFSSNPLLSKTTSSMPYTSLESSFTHKLKDTQAHTNTQAHRETNMNVTLSLGLVKVDMLRICVDYSV